MFLLNNLALVGLCFVILWGTFFPLISEAFTGEQSSVGPPWFGRYTVPLALALVFLSGLGPALAWRRTTAASLRRELVVPVAIGAATLVVLLAAGVERQRDRARDVQFRRVRDRGRGAGVRARRARAPRDGERGGAAAAAVSLVRRNRRRYGGYLVHVGVTVLLIGVAASSTFQDASDVRLSPGERAEVGGYDIQYLRPTGSIDFTSDRIAREDQPRRRPAGRARRQGLQAAHRAQLLPLQLCRPRGGVAVLRGRVHERGRPAVGAAPRPVDRRRARTRRCSTTRSSAATASSRPPPSCPWRSASALLGETLRRLVARYPTDAPPARFRVLVSPLVTWIWLGALIVLFGGLIAIWPPPAGPLARSRRSARRALRASSAGPDGRHRERLNGRGARARGAGRCACS